MRARERFLRYVQIHTQSSETSGETPSTACQKVLAELLCAELCDIGVKAEVDAHGYVYAGLPATSGCEDAPVLGFIAHMDTSPDFSGENVCPVVHENYDGGDLVLPRENRVIRVADFPFLPQLAGSTLITADGSTLLGADDKAGIAEIVTAVEEILQSGMPHGALRIGFTPDEEIGEGADHFDVARFGADYAYTVDGGSVDGIEYENFNAAGARIAIEGVSVHPGTAKDVMENALLIAMEINAQLPSGEVPARTEGYEGFYHVTDLSGDAAHAAMQYIIRDHDAAKFAARKAFLQSAVQAVQAKHPRAQISLELRDSYYNMAQKIAPCMHLIENAKKALAMEGITAKVEPIRGGTDGARLSYEGLPCPNLGTGGYNCHGPYEFAVAQQMDTAVAVIKNLVSIYAQ